MFALLVMYKIIMVKFH